MQPKNALYKRVTASQRSPSAPLSTDMAGQSRSTRHMLQPYQLYTWTCTHAHTAGRSFNIAVPEDLSFLLDDGVRR